MISEILEKCGLNEKDYTIKWSTRKFMDALFAELKINSSNKRLKILRSLDKLDRLGWDEVKKLLGKGRKDKSGDFTEGLNYLLIKFRKYMKFLFKKIDAKNENYEEGASKDITNMKNFFEIFDFKNCNFDPSIIRGLEYYTGPVFEVNLNFEVKNSKGQTNPVRFHSEVEEDTTI